MNVAFQKYGPPAAVIVVAVYLGWPPEAPMDLGEDIVRAKSVRWKLDELDSPEFPLHCDHDPFAKVLVEAPKVELTPSGEPQEIVEKEPVGPTEEQIRLGVKLAGIAQTDTHRWAIVNNRVCRCGDVVAVVGFTDLQAEIIAIEPEHIKIHAHEFDIEIKPQRHRPRQQATQAPESLPVTAPATPATTGVDDEEVDEEDRIRAQQTPDPREQFFQQASG